MIFYRLALFKIPYHRLLWTIRLRVCQGARSAQFRAVVELLMALILQLQ